MPWTEDMSNILNKVTSVVPCSSPKACDVIVLHVTDSSFLLFYKLFSLMDQSQDDKITRDELDLLQREVPLCCVVSG